MGADLIVFIAKGPRKFTKLNRKKTLKLALEIQAHVKKMVEKLKKDDHTPEEAEELDEMMGSPLLSGFRCQKGIDDLSEAEDYLDFIVAEDVPKLVTEFEDWWTSCSGRDTAGRSDPDDKRQEIRVCGEMSWGDSPDGYGYTLMDKAYMFDIPQNLGVR